jgi:hypothetical protein
MHGGFLCRVPLATDRPLDLGRQLQQQAIVGLPGLKLDAERQGVLMRRERQ